MRRAPIVLAATAAGLAATLGFQAHSAAPTAATAVTTTASGTSTTGSSSASTSAGSSRSSSASKTVTGAPAGTPYGNVQLEVTISGGRIVDVQPVQLPSADPKSVAINDYAVPLLRQSALSRQSANIDAVSGATYTSEGYRTSLQSALDTAGFRAAGAAATA